MFRSFPFNALLLKTLCLKSVTSGLLACLFLLSFCTANAGVILTIDVSNPAEGFTLTDVTAGALFTDAPTVNPSLVLDGIFQGNSGAGTATLVSGDLRPGSSGPVIGNLGVDTSDRDGNLSGTSLRFICSSN